jgi:hypothetical protein
VNNEPPPKTLNKFIGFGDIHGPKLYTSIGLGDIEGPKSSTNHIYVGLMRGFYILVLVVEQRIFTKWH